MNLNEFEQDLMKIISKHGIDTGLGIEGRLIACMALTMIATIKVLKAEHEANDDINH